MTRRALFLMVVLMALSPFVGAQTEPPAADKHTHDEASVGVPTPDSFTFWIDLLKAGGPFTVAVAATWWALKKDRQATDGATAHAAELKEMNEEVVALVGASTAAQAELRAAVNALKDGLLALERMIDRKQSGK